MKRKTDADIDRILSRFEKRYRSKKLLNLCISFLIIVLGISAVMFILNYDKDGILTFRWMTVDGTLFTVLMTSFFMAVNLIEIVKKTEMTRRPVYFARLSAAVAESIILTVVAVSWLPFSPQHMIIMRYDMFCMHVLIPVLAIASFVINDSPLGKLSFVETMIGTAFVTVYAAVIIPLILTDVVTGEYIPYFFLDFRHLGFLSILGFFLLIYATGYSLSLLLSFLNRKLYWRWFRNLTA